MRRSDLKQQLDVLANALRRLSQPTTHLRRSIAADAQRLVELEGALDAGVQSVRLLCRQLEERR